MGAFLFSKINQILFQLSIQLQLQIHFVILRHDRL